MPYSFCVDRVCMKPEKNAAYQYEEMMYPDPQHVQERVKGEKNGRSAYPYMCKNHTHCMPYNFCITYLRKEGVCMKTEKNIYHATESASHGNQRSHTETEPASHGNQR